MPNDLPPESLAGSPMQRRLDSLASQPALQVGPQDCLVDAARLMAARRVSSVAVVDADGHVLGMVGEGSLLAVLRGDLAGSTPVRDALEPMVCVDGSIPCDQAWQLCLRRGVSHLAVVDVQQRLAGVVSGNDLARAMAISLADATITQDRLRHRAILDALPDLVWLKDPDGVFLACNPRFEQLLGAPQAQIIGKTDADFVPPEVAASFRAHDQRAMARNAPTSNEELLHFASDGHCELTHTIKAPVRDPDGRLLGVLGIGRDITALRRAEDEFRLLFEHNPAPMAVYARRNQRLVAVNDAFCALYRCSRAEAVQLEVADLMTPAQRDMARRAIPQMHGLVAAEWQHLRRDGTPMQVMVQSHDLDRDGEACRVVVITDITRLHRSQQRDQSRLRLLESLVRGDPLAEQLQQLALDHEAAFPGSLCSVLLLDESGTRLAHGAGPSLPEFYNQAIHGMVIGPGMGACGTACHSGQRVVVEDIASDPRWADFRDLAARAGLASCWSTPVLGAAGRPLGTFAVYRRQPGLPGDEELDHASFAAGLAALAVGQHRNAQRLRDSERRLADTLQAIPDPIWLKDPQGQLLLANAAYRRLVQTLHAATTAASPAELTAHNLAALAADEAAVATGGQPMTAERWLAVPPDHRQALFEVVTTPMVDAQGRAAGVLGAARDITLIKQGAQALADQSRLVDTMFSQTTDAIVLVDPQTQGFVTFNDAACMGLGYTREEFAGLRPVDLQAVLTKNDVHDRDARVMAGERLVFDNTHRRRDGSLQHVQMTLRRIDFAGRPLLSVVWRDVTESRQHADRIRRLNQAYAVLSGVNEAIVRLHDTAALQAEVCRIAVDVGGFSQAWIGRHDAASGALLTEVRTGPGAAVPLPWAAPALAALHGGAPAAQDDAAGGHSVAAFPITPAGGPRSVLVLQADGAGHFDPDQLALYARLVRDVGHAVESIAAEAARRQEQRLREQLMESVAGLFFVVDIQGRLLMWNRRFEWVTGYDAEAVRASNAVDYFAPEDQPAVQQALRRVLADQEYQTEAPLRVRDGRRVPFLLVTRRVDLDTGPVVVGTGIDITDRLRADRELAQHRQHLEQLVAQRTAELEQLNRRLAREDLRLRAMLSLSQRAAGMDEPALWQHGIDVLVALVGSASGSLQPVDADGRLLSPPTWASSTHPALQPGQADGPGAQAATRACAIALQALAPAVVPLQAGHQPQQMLAVPVLDQGRCVQLLCVVHADTQAGEPGAPPGAAQDLALAGADLWDILQRRRIEIALAQAKAAADAANQAKSAFLANMSHEIRTPLNAVLGFAHLLRREPLSPRQHDHLGKIADASQHLLQVINDILDFSKIEASKVELDPIDFALQPCLQRMVAMVDDRARANRVRLHLQLDPACPAQVRGDRMRLEQILLNLLSNALKFAPGGQVGLVAQPLATGWLRFEVSDTGIGIDERQLPLLFKPFEQADASTTRRFGGTGLGLAICHRLALLMGGSIGVRSRLGEGSRFWLELPLPQAGDGAVPATPPAVPAAAAQPLLGLQVLVAEDNPINQEVALELLGAQGAQVVLAGDGQEALQRARQGRYDLVLMDVQMPRLDGLRAAAAIRQLPGWQQVPIIAMTASAFPEDRADCLAAGMDDVLVKPVDPEALTRCLLQWWRPAAPPA